jgi:YidC/Oxa1 family membrane protein insertase
MIFFFNDYSSGLSYYYFISTLITILLMIAIKQFFVDEEKLRIKMEERTAKASANPKKKSRFQERLEEMQRKANEAQKNPKRK